jgi:hypothetical protein
MFTLAMMYLLTSLCVQGYVNRNKKKQFIAENCFVKLWKINYFLGTLWEHISLLA